VKSYYPTITSLIASCPGTLLEIGSGEGEFLVHAQQQGQWEVHGCDVREHAGLDGDRRSRAEARLGAAGIPVDRYRWLNAGEPLPFREASVDVVVSIQTLEHVADPDRLFGEIARVLRPGGVALHYFPSAERIIDPHSGIPFVHREGRDRERLIRRFSRLGIGKYRRYARERGASLDDFVREFSEYLETLCHFRTLDAYIELSRRHALEYEIFGPPPLPRSAALARLCARFTSIYLWQEKPGLVRADAGERAMVASGVGI